MQTKTIGSIYGEENGLCEAAHLCSVRAKLSSTTWEYI